MHPVQFTILIILMTIATIIVVRQIARLQRTAEVQLGIERAQFEMLETLSGPDPFTTGPQSIRGRLRRIK